MCRKRPFQRVGKSFFAINLFKSQTFDSSAFCNSQWVTCKRRSDLHSIKRLTIDWESNTQLLPVSYRQKFLNFSHASLGTFFFCVFSYHPKNFFVFSLSDSFFEPVSITFEAEVYFLLPRRISIFRFINNHKKLRRWSNGHFCRLIYGLRAHPAKFYFYFSIERRTKPNCWGKWNSAAARALN